MDRYWPKLWSRLSLQTPLGGLGSKAGALPLQGSHKPLSCNSHTGCLCLGEHSTVGQIHDLVQGQQSCSSGCTAEPLGPSYLLVPTSTSNDQGTAESPDRADTSHLDCTTVAHYSLVVPATRDVDSSATTPPSPPVMPGGTHREPSTIPGTSGGSSHFREEFGRSLASYDLDEADLDFLTGHMADQSASGYNSAFKKFKLFCTNFNVDPYTCSPSYLVKFLRSKFESGASYQTICFYRSAVSKFHVGHGTLPLGQHHLVNKAIRAAFRLRPPLPKYKKTFDMNPVLNFIANLGPLEELSLKMLTLKTFLLVTFTTISRVSSVARLRKEVQETQVGYLTLNFYRYNMNVSGQFNYPVWLP